ncbi:hypothetical protein [Streptomyces djakartensis]|uniref:Lipoprotein n=1 Tax=Streptomyces djakartensis TaxID=68193 RepID=A0ABQ3A1X6_9ACTN|nr:hypothetical protein [Streptomyces djakartensis]GGY29899.1 hypothetical protein GCM10010384_41340 [Streptomyces djakartensis]
MRGTEGHGGRRLGGGTAALAVATVLLPLVAGCGGGHDDADPGAKGTQATAGQRGGSKNADQRSGDFPDKGVVVTASCSVPASNPARVTVTGWDPATWKRTVSRTFTVPAEAVVAEADDVASPLVELCADNFPGVGTSEDGPRAVAATRLRQLFDKDFSRMAVVLIDRETEATGVGYVDTSGKLTKLSGEQSEDFGDTPKEENAVFAQDGSAVWFTETDSSDRVRIASRSVAGDHAVTEQAGGDGSYMDGAGLALAGDPVRGVFGKEVRISPDGRKATAFITWKGYNVVDLPRRSALLKVGGVKASGIPSDADCHPYGWVDDRTVLCGPRLGEAEDPKRKNSFWTLDTSRLDGTADTPEGALGDPIIQATDRKNTVRAISPDGKQLIFASLQGTRLEFFTSAIAPGASPKKIAAGDADRALSVGEVLEWR